jgi:2,3-bisphosphoglycerate-independent phosphoglycerate mutase
VIFFNFRPDRARELTAPFLDKNFSHFPVKQISLAFFITPTRYKYSFHNKILLPKHPVHDTLLDALEHAGKSLFVIAETEKYATVTYFFSGGRSRLHKKETRVLIPSKKAKTHVQYPAMSAPEITKAIIESLTTDPKDFYLVNYANADMVGHSGNFESTIKAIECLDKQLAQLYNSIVKELGGTLYITGDHGNAEKKWDFVQNGPSTAHTTNPVPFIMLGKNLKNVPKLLPLKTLADIAPFILNVMKLPVPSEMQS